MHDTKRRILERANVSEFVNEDIEEREAELKRLGLTNETIEETLERINERIEKEEPLPITRVGRLASAKDSLYLAIDKIYQSIRKYF